MTNKEIISLFRNTAKLAELHGENPFKVRGYNNAIFTLENIGSPLREMSAEERKEKTGFGKGMLENLETAMSTGGFPSHDELMQRTPAGVLSMLSIKGVGAKKIRVLWQEADIDNLPALEKACIAGEVAQLKGFASKTEQKILESIRFLRANEGKVFYAHAEAFAKQIIETLDSEFPENETIIVGEFRRQCEVITELTFVHVTENPKNVSKYLSSIESLEKSESKSGPFVWRGKLIENGLLVSLKFINKTSLGASLLKETGSESHLMHIGETGKSLYETTLEFPGLSEIEYYERVGLPFIPPALRENYLEFEFSKSGSIPEMINYEDLRGPLHNHSSYSDGADTLETMAVYAKEQGWEYVGMSDHSKSAFYANGLDEIRIDKQHREIDSLNERLAPFTIFKGIESDILQDGSLDYDDSTLAKFDFVVASIHSGLEMDEQKATERLLTAIKNPYTTILGHPTGRILLKRKGYPIDHRKIIDACAEHNVIIEINANPHRLDLDWRWINYAIQKGVLLSVNPDAHETAGYHDMHYGIKVAQKAGLSAKQVFNTLSLNDVKDYFNKRKKGIATVN
ncbi:DNA polymerase/3'-5' exonuclease PolX [Fulvitalea axinellae]|uniref:DNA polymerase/3'-5' exonuclease PolX n=1 Tax=Fulvitalea axinellae TaxID=1182444 RepID=A0AAU9CKT8_9BACT|nr:DNA polymerase/3'-5' exonuclease PolX [Fulvitalea axinellae]